MRKNFTIHQALFLTILCCQLQGPVVWAGSLTGERMASLPFSSTSRTKLSV